MASQSAVRRPAQQSGLAMLAAGLIVLFAAVVLYATSVSRAAGAWITPWGAGTAAAGVWSLRTGRTPHRAVLLAMSVLALALIGLGVWTLLVAIQAEDVAV